MKKKDKLKEKCPNKKEGMCPNKKCPNKDSISPTSNTFINSGANITDNEYEITSETNKKETN